MKKTDDSILEVCFLIRSYGKGELAMCYIHGVSQQAAVNRFNTWIRKAPGLEQRLLEMGMSRTGRNYTPAQVQAIVDVFGGLRVCIIVTKYSLGYYVPVKDNETAYFVSNFIDRIGVDFSLEKRSIDGWKIK